jgi:hypothetical protein
LTACTFLGEKQRRERGGQKLSPKVQFAESEKFSSKKIELKKCSTYKSVFFVLVGIVGFKFV